MRYSSAVVLSTIVVGQAAAANLHNRHASFHARRQAEAKRSADQVDWNKVTYDLNDVDWDSVFASPSPTPTPAAAADPQPKVAEVKQPQSTKEATKEESYPTSTEPAPTPSAKPTDTSDSYGLGDAIDDITDGAEDLIDNIGDFVNGLGHMITNIAAKVGKNPTSESKDDPIWIGSDSKWKAVFTNDKDEDAVLFCWKSDNFSNMCINTYQPEISAGLKSGESIEISFSEGTSSACAPVFPDTVLAEFGGVRNTWWESTFKQKDGTFDVSRNVWMNGNTISSKGSKCKSDMTTCVFKCKDDSLESCESGYDLLNCDASNGGGGGFDVNMGGVGGGCAMGYDSETVQVVFS
ncbi:putative effector 5 [Stemphylium lycopersici]|uniref:Effector 5 n=1 Tax=Stemphylium lycopersici TaxID=183478 RepID=A0A364N8K5_STELY|nr:putative effector 5 [Stemphylium lycopersici]RAR12352.1 putative effector 5 [Stemphylium lycopersici]RAR13590.1 effector 5 [Stemphylium lycopersici]